MKNITLSVENEVLSSVRKYAAERDTSVNALVRDYLSRIAARVEDGRTARLRLRELSESSPSRLGEKTWTRQDLHER